MECTRHVIGTSEEKPLSFGWCETERLGTSRKSWYAVSTPYIVGWLVDSLDLLNACTKGCVTPARDWLDG